MFFRKSLLTERKLTLQFKSFEHLDISISYLKFTARLLVLHRPPPSKKNQLTLPMFYDEFSRLIEILVDEPNPLPITGDFNFHVDDSGNLEAMRFLDLLNSANLVQHVLEPSHRRGHTLDLIITRRDEVLIRHV